MIIVFFTVKNKPIQTRVAFSLFSFGFFMGKFQSHKKKMKENSDKFTFVGIINIFLNNFFFTPSFAHRFHVKKDTNMRYDTFHKKSIYLNSWVFVYSLPAFIFFSWDTPTIQANIYLRCRNKENYFNSGSLALLQLFMLTLCKKSHKDDRIFVMYRASRCVHL